MSAPLTGLPDLIPNDGAVDPTGRLWFGTSHADETEPRGIIFRSDDGERFEPADAGFTVCNGPAFSVDGTVLYLSDTMSGTVLTYDVERSGALRRRRVLLRLPDGELPDGLTVDAEGCLWVAHWGGACVTRWSPDGELLRRLSVPTPLVTAVRFGGTDLDELYITTAREEGSGPDAGLLYATRPGVRGLPQTVWREAA
jgi:sugar lactone lactonase YvrE